MLQNKFKKNGVCFDASLVAIIDSFDAANHLITDMGTTSIICFSSQLVSARTVSKGFTSTESLNIFTWKQVQKKESGKVVFFFCSRSLQKEKQLMAMNSRSKNKVHLYDMHDGKMLQILTKYSLYNRKFIFHVIVFMVMAS